MQDLPSLWLAALLREAIPIKNLLPFGIFPKGGGVMSESKRFEELFCSVHVWTFFQKRGGLPDSKLFEELFSLCLEIFRCASISRSADH